jgi:D-glycero-D-manno-heptose 1,7-bisphosphate phosphatase
MSRPAVFLDRDGTLIEDVGYVDRLERLQLYPWSLEAVRREHMVIDVLESIQERLSAIGEQLDGHYYCPHLTDASVEAYRRDCSCHKPRPGMVEEAVAALDLDLSRSYVVGDRWTDIQLAQAVGAKAILVKTGYGVTQLSDSPPGEPPNAVFGNLLEAVGWVLSE